MCHPMAGFDQRTPGACAPDPKPTPPSDGGKVVDAEADRAKPKGAPEVDKSKWPHNIPAGMPFSISSYVGQVTSMMCNFAGGGCEGSQSTSGAQPSGARPAPASAPAPLPPSPGEVAQPVRRPESQDRPSRGHMDFRVAVSLFARDAVNAAEKFSDAVVAAAVHDIKVAGEVAEKVAVPVIVIGALAFGAAKMIETGDTSTFNRAITALGF